MVEETENQSDAKEKAENSKIWPLQKPETEEEKKQQEIDQMVKQMMDQFQDKKYKAEYLQLQQQYITDLKLMS